MSQFQSWPPYQRPNPPLPYGVLPPGRDPVIYPQEEDLNYVKSLHPQLAGETVLVTGAGIGLGRGIALECAREGAEVVLHHYKEESGVDSARRLIEGIGGKASVVKGDLSQLSEVQRVFENARNNLGRPISVLVNNSGITTQGSFLETTPQDYSRLFDVNVKAAFFLSQLVARDMVDNGVRGRMVFIGSLHATKVLPYHSVYGLTKAAIESLVTHLGTELLPHGIRTIGIRPGWGLSDNHIPEPSGARTSEQIREDFRNSAKGFPAGCINTPRELGRAVISLLGTSMEILSGTTVALDGAVGNLFPGQAPTFRNPPPQKGVRQGERYMGGE